MLKKIVPVLLATVFAGSLALAAPAYADVERNGGGGRGGGFGHSPFYNWRPVIPGYPSFYYPTYNPWCITNPWCNLMQPPGVSTPNR